MRARPSVRLAACVACIVALAAPRSSPAEPAASARERGDGAFSFVVWGHPRGRGDGEPQLHLEETLARIAELEPDLLILTGDMIWGAIRAAPADVAGIVREDFERLDAALEPLGIPVFRLPGNHDVHSTATRDVYLERYPEPPYAFTWESSRFILLDSIGIRQRAGDDGSYWGGGPLPFDAEQLAFLENELADPDAWRHVFVFVHHAAPWVEADGFWWSDVHPILRGRRVRAVFSGSPWSFKYAHLEEDGIHYILSTTHETKPAAQLATELRANHLGLNRQPDTLQRVRVRGDEVSIETLVVGAHDTDGLSPRFWDAVEQARPRVVERAHRLLRSPRRIAFFLLAYGGGALLAGILAGAWWQRRGAR